LPWQVIVIPEITFPDGVTTEMIGAVTYPSPALDISAQIAAAGAVVTIHDPKAIEPAKKRFPALGFSEDIEEVLKGADLVLHLTEWKVYRELDPAKLVKLVANPIIIDGRNALDREAWIAAGWKFRALGRAN
jgi:UDPglucose 6-dehydrogenase